MRDADRELFRAWSPPGGGVWPSDLPGGLVDPGRPVVKANGLPPTPFLHEPPAADPARDFSWLRVLGLPEMPVRWDARVVRYLGYYRDEPRGRNLIHAWMKKSGRYGATIRRVLREQGLPEDLVWVSMVESGFEPAIKSHAGAAGLWQLMPEGARAYGLTVDKWIDERLDPERSTEAAARYLADLYRRLGAWELALAAYNMGYGGLLTAMRKYNTNDFWELTKIESGVPYETALYVPKIIAIAVAAKNAPVFGLDPTRLDPPIVFDPVPVAPGVSIKAIASAANVSPSVIEAMNPQLRAGRTPPESVSADTVAWTVRVPLGKGIAVSRKHSPPSARDGATDVDDAESLAAAAPEQREAAQVYPFQLDMPRPFDVDAPSPFELKLRHPLEANPAGQAEAAKGAVPAGAGERPRPAPPLLGPDDKPVVVHPVDAPRFPGHRRVFYRIVPGDTLRDIASAFHVTSDDLCRWNALDLTARLQEGMTLQVFVRDGADLRKVSHLTEADVHCLTVGSDEFFAYFEAQRGRKRTTIVVEEGDTWAKIARRFNLTLGQLERINHRSRGEKLNAKETLVVYAPLGQSVAHQADSSAIAPTSPSALGPVVAPHPDDLPGLPDLPERPTSTEPSASRGLDGVDSTVNGSRLTH